MVKPLIVVHSKNPLSQQQRESLGTNLKEFADREGYACLITDGDITATADNAELLEAMLGEQRKTNELLVMLIEAMAEADGDPDAEPMRYMDGTPAR